MRKLPPADLSPFGRWLSGKSITDQEVSDLLSQKGIDCCARYVRQIANSRRTCSFDVARGLSEITNGEISAAVIYDWKRKELLERARPKGRAA